MFAAVMMTCGYSPRTAWKRKGKPSIETSGSVVVPSSACTALAVRDSAYTRAPKSAATSRAASTSRITRNLRTRPVFPAPVSAHTRNPEQVLCVC